MSATQSVTLRENIFGYFLPVSKTKTIYRSTNRRTGMFANQHFVVFCSYPNYPIELFRRGSQGYGRDNQAFGLLVLAEKFLTQFCRTLALRWFRVSFFASGVVTGLHPFAPKYAPPQFVKKKTINGTLNQARNRHLLEMICRTINRKNAKKDRLTPK